MAWFARALKVPGPSSRRPVIVGTSPVAGERNQGNFNPYPECSHRYDDGGMLLRDAQILPWPNTGAPSTHRSRRVEVLTAGRLSGARSRQTMRLVLVTRRSPFRRVPARQLWP